MKTHLSYRFTAGFDVFPSPHDEGVGRGTGRGVSERVVTARTNPSPQASPRSSLTGRGSKPSLQPWCRQAAAGAMPTRRSGVSHPGQRGYLLIEALIYIGVLTALLGVGYAAMYRCIDSSIALRRNADEITGALHAGERWRADVRAANSQPRLESTDDGQLFHLGSARGAVAYRVSTNAVFRRLGEGPWVRLLANAKSSTMTADPRKHVTAWRWELELQPRQSGSVKPSRVRPLFTFIAVPEQPSAK